MNNRYYDSLISYKYTSYKKFKNFKMLKTNVCFKNYLKFIIIITQLKRILFLGEKKLKFL